MRSTSTMRDRPWENDCLTVEWITMESSAT
jgi:hypothetical protein